MPKHNPEKTPEVTVKFNYSPEYPASHDDPGCEAEAEITDIEINDMPVSDNLADHLIERFGEDWQAEIIQRAVAYKRFKRRI